MEMASARATSIGDLAYTREHVRADAEVREVAALFEQTFDLEAVAVVAEDGDFGLVVRSRLTSELGRQFGYALYSRKPIQVSTDAVLLRRVLTNLLSNALKFTDRGSVTLSARADGASLVISVRDTGLGIREQDQPLLFRKFAQLEGTKTKRHSGTGLGLAIVKNLVALLGGSISVSSELGVGSEFSVFLPAPAARIAI
ncbi:MAG TPA: ATP-binding protein [Polyangiaceae bacterium]|jgi:signal transduction histidine kinase